MKRSRGEKIFQVLLVFLLTGIMMIAVYPILYVAFASISEPVRIASHRGILLRPLGFSLKSYKMVFENPNILTSYGNTLIILFVGTSLNVVLTTLGAYALSRKRLGFRNVIMFAIVLTMMFRGGLIPLYLQVSHLGLINTRWALILPTAVSAWNLIIMRTFLQGIPDSLEESARIDGANDWTILFRIIVPLSTPVLAVMVLFYGVYNWNSWFHAVLFLRERTLFPLQLILREVLIANVTDSMTTSIIDSSDEEMIGETIRYSIIMVATLPVVFIYPLLQKYFMKGVMIGAIKG